MGQMMIVSTSKWSNIMMNAMTTGIGKIISWHVFLVVMMIEQSLVFHCEMF